MPESSASSNPLVLAAEALIQEKLAGDSSGHDWHHIDRVRRMALRLAREEGADAWVVELAALLHDVADWKFHAGDIDAGPRVAREWLVAAGVDEATCDRVARIVAEVTFKGAGVETPASSLESAVVQDADRLDAIGAIGVARAFAYGGHKGRPLHDPAIPPTPHQDFAAYKKNAGPTLNHFYEKLFLLKDRLHTASARRVAAARHRYLEEFVAEFLAEWSGER